MFLPFIYFGLLCLVNSFFINKPKLNNRSLNMLIKNNEYAYAYAKEYQEFYNKYKTTKGLQLPQKESSQDFAERHKENYFIFENNYKLIQETKNSLSNKKNSFSIELNKYADIVDFNNNNNLHDDLNCKLSETDNIVKTFNFQLFIKSFKNPFGFFKKKRDDIKINWNDTSYLSSVKNQGRCGSCYAFSTTNVLETFMRINNFSVDRLSEQQIVDCSPKDYGCEGGFMHTAFDFIIENKGLLSNDDYKYQAITQNCSSSQSNGTNVIGSNILEYQFVVPNSVEDFKDSLQKSPVAIALDADNVYFRFYRDGIIDVPLNVSKSINHAVVLVGFDYDEEGMYWIIQNSWGQDWGDNGFCKIRVKEGEGVLQCQKYGVYPVK